LLVDTSELSSVGVGTRGEGGGADEAASGAPSGSDAEGDAAALDASFDGAAPVLALDTFTRTTQDGLGDAEIGGTWQLGGDPARFSVANGSARIVLPAAGVSSAAALGIETDDAELDLVLATNKLGSGSGLYVSAVVRQVGKDVYRGALIIGADARVAIELARIVSGAEAVLGSRVYFPSIVPGEALRIRIQAMGTSPSRLRLKVWKATGPEPSSWTLQATDSSPSLQATGGVGLNAYLSSTATNAPIAITMDDVLVRPASLVP
jgi:hypothetical protein